MKSDRGGQADRFCKTTFSIAIKRGAARA